MRPLTHLTRDVPFVWGEDQQWAFHDLRLRLRTPPVLTRFDEHSPTILHADASNASHGAVIVQQRDGTERVIAYASRTLLRTVANYSTTEKECLTVVWAVLKCRAYWYGHCVTVVGDHHALRWLTNLEDPAGQLACWSLQL